MNSSSSNDTKVTIVVPIFNALDEVERCLRSVENQTAKDHRIILIDDGSSDERVWPLLRRYAARIESWDAVRQPRNRGYTATINHGCRLAGRDDVVLLNSDTIVTSGWVDKLNRAAGKEPKVATVTPLSNAAGAFSVPVNHRANRLPEGMSPSVMAELIEELSDRLYPRVPTGNGFCLYIRREALDCVGPFDDKTFPHGCGEENDFCMRASRLGFTHLIDDTTYIFHRGSASLGWRKRVLLMTSAWKLRWRYPEYHRLVAAWLENDPLEPLRYRLKQRLAHESSSDRESPVES